MPLVHVRLGPLPGWLGHGTEPEHLGCTATINIGPMLASPRSRPSAASA